MSGGMAGRTGPTPDSPRRSCHFFPENRGMTVPKIAPSADRTDTTNVMISVAPIWALLTLTLLMVRICFMVCVLPFFVGVFETRPEPRFGVLRTTTV